MRKRQKSDDSHLRLFDELKQNIILLDPVAFIDHYLSINGNRFNLSEFGAGWRYMAEIYRNVAMQAENKNSKPIVILKGRQVGATVMAAALSIYFAASGLYGTNAKKPPIKILHLFPTLKMTQQYAKERLEPMLRDSIDNYVSKRAIKYDKKLLGNALEDTITEKSFIGFNKIRVDSVGRDADRIRGTSQDVLLYDECFPYDQHIETESGEKSIGSLCDMYHNNMPLPRVKTYNEDTQIFEYKDIVKVWSNGQKSLLQVACGNIKVRCTENHPFLTERGWIKAQALIQGDFLKTAPGMPPCIVDNVVPLDDVEEVFDIEVKDNHNFIITSNSKSKNASGIIVHNCQDMRRAAIENSLAVLTATPYGTKTQGVQLYFGTPKQTGTYFWELWKNSDKRFYELKCGSCAHYFQLYNLEDDSWLDIWVHGDIVKCPQCGFHQRKQEAVDRGRWTPTVEGDTRYTGYHFNMMLSPIYTKEDVLKKYPKTSGTSERAWKNEVLGDFYSGAGQPLTIEDIENNALDITRGTSKIISNKNDTLICLGADWGDKDDGEGGSLEGGNDKGQSYSAIVIISVDKAGVITIENAFRLKNNEFTYKVKVLQKLFDTFKINTGAADYMWGADVCNFMQKDLGFGNRFLKCYTLGGSTKMYAYDPQLMKMNINKNLMIDEVFSMIRQGKIKFPAKGLAYEQLRWLREHCASMEIETKVRDGMVTKGYKKGATQNDGLMALLYAIAAYKYLATGGFKTSDVNQSESSAPKPILGWVPRL